MNRLIVMLVATLALLLGSVGQAKADPLTLDYSVTPSGSLFDYSFTLTLDNHDNSWAAGQGFGWLIFGDAPYPNASPIADFTLTSAAPGPWTYLTFSEGGHNGPTFGYVLSPWVPAAVGDQLTWTGTSATDLGQGQLLFSTLYNTGGAIGPNFDVANLTTVPEPSGFALLGLATIMFVGYCGWRRRKLVAA